MNFFGATGSAVLLGLAACAGPATSPTASDPEVVELPTRNGAGGPDARTHGQLEGDPDEGCVWLVEGLEEGEELDPAMSLVWPDGFAFGTATLEVLAPDGEPVASVGDDLLLGGGEVDHIDPERCEVSDRTWIVTSIDSS